MSIVCLEKVMFRNISPEIRPILVTICDWSNDDGEFFMSENSIATKCEMEISIVLKHIRHFTDIGLLSKIDHFNGKDVYAINLNLLDEMFGKEK